MRPDTITLAIFEKYSPQELAETAEKLVQALADKETAETEKKTSDAVFKERINKHEAEAAALAKQYGKGGETAQIGCDIRYDQPSVGQKSYVRMDSGEVVETHDMSWEEKQETIQFPLSADSATSEMLSGVKLCMFPGCVLPEDHDGEHSIHLAAETEHAQAETEAAKPETPAKKLRKKKAAGRATATRRTAHHRRRGPLNPHGPPHASHLVLWCFRHAHRPRTQPALPVRPAGARPRAGGPARGMAALREIAQVGEAAPPRPLRP